MASVRSERPTLLPVIFYFDEVGLPRGLDDELARLERSSPIYNWAASLMAPASLSTSIPPGYAAYRSHNHWGRGRGDLQRAGAELAPHKSSWMMGISRLIRGTSARLPLRC